LQLGLSCRQVALAKYAGTDGVVPVIGYNTILNLGVFGSEARLLKIRSYIKIKNVSSFAFNSG